MQNSSVLSNVKKPEFLNLLTSGSICKLLNKRKYVLEKYHAMYMYLYFFYLIFIYLIPTFN